MGTREGPESGASQKWFHKLGDHTSEMEWQETGLVIHPVLPFAFSKGSSSYLLSKDYPKLVHCQGEPGLHMR